MEKNVIIRAAKCGVICTQSEQQNLYTYLAQSTNQIPWSLLDDLLVPPLNGALSLIEVDL